MILLSAIWALSNPHHTHKGFWEVLDTARKKGKKAVDFQPSNSMVSVLNPHKLVWMLSWPCSSIRQKKNERIHEARLLLHRKRTTP
ncbi:hypothetical protein DUNSADRAFT_16263 [Dunaliella salina]|uniref:Secreted protein n=1 Tax=Dunaliella salina TaxID=3046 RepID=A0ABQ7G3Y7_DUNSA|nr:hypothetical protein DUNSADRAFT_16263 [Dunaliella salina]|eukprot:KAF5829321.1 hypothetical protein DUNSADRAFT_16263 [Dunaliella salina]